MTTSHARRALVGLAAAAAALALGAPAAGALTVLDDVGDFDEPGAVFASGHAVWGNPDGSGGIRLRALPLAGGAPFNLPSIAARSGEFAGGFRLAGSASRLAARVQFLVEGDEVFVREQRQAAPFGAALKVVGSRRPSKSETSFDGYDFVRAITVVDDGLVTVEPTASDRLRVMFHSDGGTSREIPLPPGANSETIEVAGDLLAVAVLDPGDDAYTDDVAVVLLDRRTGAELRRVTIPKPLRNQHHDLALSADGALAFVEGAKIGWAPAGADRFVALRVPGRDAAENPVAVAGGRIAGVRRTSAGVSQVVVMEPAAGGGTLRYAYRGPPATEIQDVEFDGSHLAWKSRHCRFLTTIGERAVEDRIPAGRCVRADASVVTRLIATGRRSAVPVRVRCLTAVGKACGVNAVVEIRRRSRTLRFRSARTRVPVGRARTIRVPIGRRAAHQLDANPFSGNAFIQLHDGGGASMRVETDDYRVPDG